ncbi:hypothetical protein Hypma_006056 [Hypsizygus marmoreus]|uniref:CCHC-type domain-containing protein n=1 Tax=Hypsizygus marmoreus TaxID=39966 RepID=A0A369JXE1_HYPMA|nr:hypothetical protein Hypma_006056 [Hypsizygus marmoreus]
MAHDLELLNDTNYSDWSIKMEALLVEKDLWDVVAGTEVMPTTGPNSKTTKAFVRKQKLARAKIILHVENSQLPHTRHSDPKEIWDNLARVHRSRGFGTLLAMRRRFFALQKHDDISMQAWIAQVRDAAFHLEAAEFPVDDLDLIIVLTQGLPESYDPLIITLDSTPIDELDVDNIITRLLNEETRQKGDKEHFGYVAVGKRSKNIVDRGKRKGKGRDAKSEKGRNSSQTDSKHMRCFNCRGRGHRASKCPSPKFDADDQSSASTEDPDKDDKANVARGSRSYASSLSGFSAY